jgi:branched-chain amino acid transport system substrate-binding protein
VLFTFQILGTPPNTAVQAYLNDNKVPKLFVATDADKWNDPKHHPWTMGWQPSYRIEARIYARYILKTSPMPRSRCSIRTTISGRTISSACAKGWAIKPTR